MSKVLQLMLKDLRLELRNRAVLLSIVLYLGTLIYLSYFTFQEGVTSSTWNALYWLITLFALLTGVGKSFLSEEDRSSYYYYLVRPGQLALSKLLFNVLYGLLLNCFVFFLIQIFLPLIPVNKWFFLVNNILGTAGLCCSFTLVSSISSNTKNQNVMMSVLGFPIAIPILIMTVANSKKALLGAQMSEASGSLTSLVSIDVIIIALILILFPYSWKK